ncbi:hypothetical protein EDD29_0222 [Actinocorallia herbida]|uniref:Capsular polysaccharide biosynthesis protein n=1 Tax=Actinocorallia herbida TaxID=58109 RepID=A0A3N1CN47_9ACTN|nr:hypothetical protein [Actinocorallia herbida]ROO82739.1 hypothetical protein EDD29_0222 [Actinocorallia herbida]
MDFWGTVLVLFRRWYITGTAFALAIAGMALAYVSIPTEYVSGATLIITKPTSPAEGNPLLDFDKGLNLTASILVAALQTPESLAELGVSPDEDPTFTINNGSPNPELLVQTPFLFITGTSTRPAEATAMVRRVADKVVRELVRQQQLVKAPRASYLTISVIAPPSAPLPEKAGKSRAAVITLAVGGIAGVFAGFAAESLAVARRTRRLRKVDVASAA